MLTISKKARSVKNSLHNLLSPINQLPPETLALIATFFAKERELTKATAVCQYWRTTLLSFPRLWCNVGGSPAEIEAYLERSKSVPIDVDLHDPELNTQLIVPHISRLASLTVRPRHPSYLRKCEEHLRSPIPALRSFHLDIGYCYGVEDLELPSNFFNGSFSRLKKLDIGVVSSFRGPPQAFHCVTELTLRTNSDRISALFGIFEQLPALERVHITFQPRITREDNSDPTPSATVILPHLQELSLSTFKGYGSTTVIPKRILGFLKLPNLKSLRVELEEPQSSLFHPILPVAPIGEHLPNFAELPELQVDLDAASNEFRFKGPSQAVFTWIMRGWLQQFPYYTLRVGLPLNSVRRLTVYMRDMREGSNEWIVVFLQDLDFLEQLELGGECGGVLQRLHDGVAQGKIHLHIQNLIVRAGEYEKRAALEFESAKDAMGLGLTVTYIPDPKMCGKGRVGRRYGWSK
jgi:hypothetical protein